MSSSVIESSEEEEELETAESQEKTTQIDLVGKYIGGRNINSERHGQGWALLPNGDQYEGDYRQGQRHGFGLYIFENGARYLGQYRCGLKSGQGIFIYPDGSIYDGSWRKDLKHGFGTYIYSNSDIYRGNWYKDQRHGVGSYTFNNKFVVFNGTWKNGIRIGPAEVHYKNHSFHGNWHNKYPLGPGVFTFNCKYMNIGYYKSETISPIDNKSSLPSSIERRSFSNNEMEQEIVNEEFDSERFAEERSESDEKVSIPTVWIGQEFAKYDFSKLPQQPVPPPLSDSEESVCELSIESPHEENIEISKSIQSEEESIRTEGISDNVNKQSSSLNDEECEIDSAHKMNN